MTWAVERVPTLVPMRIARITVDMHRAVPVERLHVGAEIVRQGKRVQLVLATITDDRGIEVARATALRLRLGEGPPQTTDPRRPALVTPPFGPVRPRRAEPRNLNGFAAALETRDAGEAPGSGWYRVSAPIVAGEASSPTVRLAWASDFTANSGNYLDHAHWSAINPDLTIHLARPPIGEWTCVATRNWYERDGIGHARADLFDVDGFVGTCTAAALVDEVPAPYFN